MIDIEPDDEETFEDRLFERADNIGDIVTGKRKYTKEDFDQIKIYADRLLNKGKKRDEHGISPVRVIKKSPPKPNPLIVFINKYKSMPLSRLIGLSIIILFAVITIVTAAYLMFSIMVRLMNSGILGIIGFGILAFGLCMSTLLFFTLKYNRK
jgi:hypothetical protein